MEFFSSINTIRINTFKQSSIRSAWQQAGIVPWNPSKVINRLHIEFNGIDVEQHFQQLEEHAQELLQLSSNELDKVEGSRPLTPPPFELPQTPLTIRTLSQAGIYLQQRLEEQLSSPSQNVLNRYIRGSVIQAAQGAQALSDLHNTEAATKARKQRSNSKRQLSKGGVLYASKARQMVKDKEQKEAQKKTKKDLKQGVNKNTNNSQFTVQWMEPVCIDPQLLK